MNLHHKHLQNFLCFLKFHLQERIRLAFKSVRHPNDKGVILHLTCFIKKADYLVLKYTVEVPYFATNSIAFWLTFLCPITLFTYITQYLKHSSGSWEFKWTITLYCLQKKKKLKKLEKLNLELVSCTLPPMPFSPEERVKVPRLNSRLLTDQI